LAHGDLWRFSREQNIGERHTLKPSHVKWVHGWEQPQCSAMSITSSGCCSQKVCRIHMAADSTDSTPL
jgi:hypothetical protein